MEQFIKVGTTFSAQSDLYRLEIGTKEPATGKGEVKKDEEKEEKRETNSSNKKIQLQKEESLQENRKSVEKEPNNTQFSPAEQEETPKGLQKSFERTETKEQMNRMRIRIAERMKEAQNTAASLTTFNEVDMTSIMQVRSTYKQQILDKYKLKFGFMSFFVKACTIALTEIPIVNGRIEDSQIIHPNYVDISVAVATPKGLVTPVLRNCHLLDLIQIEQAIHEMAEKAREGRITLDDLSGGTFTISNGGIFGSLSGTPIINSPQSAILGMHAIKDRPVVVKGEGGLQILPRPMMNLALTYDHRLIDGREAVTFLVRIKQMLEEPQRMLLGV